MPWCPAVSQHGGNRVRASITFTAPSTSTTTTSGTTTTGSGDTGSAAAASSSSDAQASGGAAVSFDLSSDFEYSGTFIYHGLSMLVSWGFVVPIACLVCRYARCTCRLNDGPVVTSYLYLRCVSRDQVLACVPQVGHDFGGNSDSAG